MSHFFPIRSYHFRQDFVHYFMSIVMICKQTGGYIYTLVSGEFHLAATCSQNKNRPEKYPFMAKLNCISCSMVCKVCLYSEFPNIPESLVKGRRKARQMQSVMLYK